MQGEEHAGGGASRRAEQGRGVQEDGAEERLWSQVTVKILTLPPTVLVS